MAPVFWKAVCTEDELWKPEFSSLECLRTLKSSGHQSLVVELEDPDQNLLLKSEFWSFSSSSAS